LRHIEQYEIYERKDSIENTKATFYRNGLGDWIWLHRAQSKTWSGPSYILLAFWLVLNLGSCTHIHSNLER